MASFSIDSLLLKEEPVESVFHRVPTSPSFPPARRHFPFEDFDESEKPFPVHHQQQQHRAAHQQSSLQLSLSDSSSVPADSSPPQPQANLSGVPNPVRFPSLEMQNNLLLMEELKQRYNLPQQPAPEGAALEEPQNLMTSTPAFPFLSTLLSSPPSSTGQPQQATFLSNPSMAAAMNHLVFAAAAAASSPNTTLNPQQLAAAAAAQHHQQRTMFTTGHPNSTNPSNPATPFNRSFGLLGSFQHGYPVGVDGAFLYPPSRKSKRTRTAFLPQQLFKLESAFQKNHYVVGQERKELARSLDLSETQVKVWFQNRRTKHKRMKAEDGETSGDPEQHQPSSSVGSGHQAERTNKDAAEDSSERMSSSSSVCQEVMEEPDHDTSPFLEMEDEDAAQEENLMNTSKMTTQSADANSFLNGPTGNFLLSQPSNSNRDFLLLQVLHHHQQQQQQQQQLSMKTMFPSPLTYFTGNSTPQQQSTGTPVVGTVPPSPSAPRPLLGTPLSH